MHHPAIEVAPPECLEFGNESMCSVVYLSEVLVCNPRTVVMCRLCWRVGSSVIVTLFCSFEVEYCVRCNFLLALVCLISRDVILYIIYYTVLLVLFL